MLLRAVQTVLKLYGACSEVCKRLALRVTVLIHVDPIPEGKIGRTSGLGFGGLSNHAFEFLGYGCGCFLVPLGY